MATAFYNSSSGDKNVVYYTDANGNLKNVGVRDYKGRLNPGAEVLDLSKLQSLELGNTPQFQAATLSGWYDPNKGGLPEGSIGELKSILSAGAVAPTDLKPIDQRNIGYGDAIPTQKFTDWVNQNSGSGATKLTPGGSPLYQSGEVQNWLDSGQPNTAQNSSAPAGWTTDASGHLVKIDQGSVSMAGASAPTGEYIPNEATLQEKRNELAKAGVPQSEWGKYISSPDANGKLFYTQPATLYGTNGEKKVVATGSAEANSLFKLGWTLNPQSNGSSITPDNLKPATPLNVGTGTSGDNGGSANQAAASAQSYLDAQQKIAENQKLLTPPETELDKLYKQLTGDVSNLSAQDTGRGAAQLEAEAAAGVAGIKAQVDDISGQITSKLAERAALKASYESANTAAEGQYGTLASLSGVQAQNYRNYLAQDNNLVASIGLLQATGEALQNKLNTAQATADRAVDLKYADIESTLKAKINQLSILQPQLDKEDAVYANAVKMYLQQQSDALAEQKDKEKTLTAFNLDLMAKYPDVGILLTDTPEVAQKKVSGSKVFQQATRLAGGGGGSTTVAPIKFTPDEKKTILAIGANTFTPELQNVLINALTPTERTKFMKDWKAEQDRQGMSIDPAKYIEAWAKQQDSGNDFTPEENRKLEQAGILNATRKEQLDFLYSKSDDNLF